jgi:PAS domain S-box-containing protein
MVAEQRGHLGLWSYNTVTGEQIWSPGVHKLLGTNPLLDKPSTEVFMRNLHPADRYNVLAERELLKEGIVTDQKFRVIDPEGSLRWLSCATEIHYAKDGSPSHVTGMLLDITERQNIAEVMRTRSELLSVLGKHFRFTTWSADERGALTSVIQWSSLGAGSPAQLLEWKWLGLVPDSQRKDFALKWKQSIAKGAAFTCSVEMLLGPKTRRTMAIYAAPTSFKESRNRWIGFIAQRFDLDRLSFEEADIKAGHIRAARALLDWSIETLSVKSSVSVSTIRRMESNESGPPRLNTARAVMQAFEEAGVMFDNQNGRVTVSL